MKHLLSTDRRIRAALEVFFLFSWSCNLTGTDSFFTVYLLCAVIGVLCLCDNVKTCPVQPRWVRWLTILFSALFSIATVLANYPLFEPISSLLNLVNAACSLAGGYFLAYNVLVCAIHRLPQSVKADARREETSPVLVFLIFFAMIAGVFLLYLFTTGYPVYLAADSLTSMDQITSGVYSNHHPYWYTRFIGLCLNIGYLFSPDKNVACAVYSSIQCLIMAACFAYTLVTLYQAGIPRWCIGITFLMYAFLPYNLTYSITMWKDTLFGGFTLLLVLSLFRIIRKIGKWEWLNYLVFALGGIGFCLVRNNGLPVLLILAIAMLIFLGKRYKKLLLITLLVLLFAWIMTGPVLDALNVADTEIVEVLAVPLQQIARVIANDCPISDADMDVLSRIFWIDRVKELYSPEIVDPIKFEAMQPGGEAYITEHFGAFLGLWVRLGVQNPGEYVKAWVELTKGFWNGGYYFWIYIRWTYPELSGVGGFTMDNPGKDIFDAIFRFAEKPDILQPLYSIGLQVWIAVSCCFVCFAQKRKEFLIALPMVILAAVLWFMTPVYAEFRYAYPMFVTCPMLLAITVFQGGSAQERQCKTDTVPVSE